MTVRTLIVDTCSLLDLIRAPVRLPISSEQIAHALNIKSALMLSQPLIRVVVCDWVVGEYRRGVDGVAQEARQLLKSMWNSHRQAEAVMATYCGHPVGEFDVDDWIENIIDRGKDLAESFIQTTLPINATDDDERLATQRTRQARAPSHKGKGSLADAVVTEIGLRVARAQGRDENGKPLVILLSANTHDFCDGKLLKSELQSEFDIDGLGFASNWIIARYACFPRATSDKW